MQIKAPRAVKCEGVSYKSRRRPVKTKFAIVTLAGSLMVGAAAYAQGLTLPWDEMSPLTGEDRAMIKDTVQRQIHDQRPNTVAKWANPASGHSGTITLLSKLVRQGMPCERIEYQIVEPGGQQQHGHYIFTSCQLSDGTWKLAD